MALLDILAQQISSNSLNRGQQYFLRKRVSLDHIEPGRIEASVRGTQVYTVSILEGHDEIAYSCTCPHYFDTAAACKHVTATLIAAEAEGVLKTWDPSDIVELVPMEDSDLELDDERIVEDFSRARSAPAGFPKSARWMQQLKQVRTSSEHSPARTTAFWPEGRELLYVVDLARTMDQNGVIVEINIRDRKKNGQWAKPRAHVVSIEIVAQIPNELDRKILLTLLGAPRDIYSYYQSDTTSRFRITGEVLGYLLPLMAESGHLYLRDSSSSMELAPLAWDSGDPWLFHIEARHDAEKSEYILRGWLRRGEERVDLSEPAMLTAAGVVFFRNRAARLDYSESFSWIVLLRRDGQIRLPERQRDAWLREILQMPSLPPMDLPPELGWEETRAIAPRPFVKIHAPRWSRQESYGELAFDYDGALVREDAPGNACFDPAVPRRIVRDLDAERMSSAFMKQAGFRPTGPYTQERWVVPLRQLPSTIQTLLSAGWRVEAEGKRYRTPGRFALSVASGIDWFELRASVPYDDTQVSLPALLAALQKGERAVRLDDGTYGILPEEWLRKYGILAGLGSMQGGALRFRKNQVGLLDALLASEPQATCDAAFHQAREQLQRFHGIAPADPPSSFTGTLRPYQREGLGWLHFLRDFGFGGCLADDMGLGKTVQVLALLESRRVQEGQVQAPSLVVVPRSLVFNWKQEAARFTPSLRVLDHTGTARLRQREGLQDYDLVVTTYGTLRRDALFFKEIAFDYVILDEAQAIKNASTEAAKAARLLKGAHQLALSGTPIENHLGELWSLFEFLNPGLLGSDKTVRLGEGELRNPGPETRALLARFLRPFILRRTKEQVARDLPAKTEQTILCELELEQRKLYDELRAHYQRSLLGRIEQEGIAKSKIQILEALLRLRQAACHPGLIDPGRLQQSSAKLDALQAQLEEVLEEGHKALVFSQFTSFLAILRKRLDSARIPYLYLDGKTQERGALVDRFQNDAEGRLFLISLRAGGLGLNLTAAEYVFLLDPWWNPAVEAQAIDRSHRIGQTRPVFAYRLIARDTVEEKVLELQKSKRDLAEAIIQADRSLIRDLKREDLELLLS